MTCCLCSSSKTLLMQQRRSLSFPPPLMSRSAMRGGRFSDGHQWPVMTVHRGPCADAGAAPAPVQHEHRGVAVALGGAIRFGRAAVSR